MTAGGGDRSTAGRGAARRSGCAGRKQPVGLAALACLGFILQALGFALFFEGFFPSSPRPPGRAGAPKAAPQFDRVAVLLVDGLPSELVLGPRDGRTGCDVCRTGAGEGFGMPFLVELLCTGQGVGFRTRAAAPTVTLPRIKALVGGEQPGLRDLVLNFAAGPGEGGDSLIEQAHRLGWTTVVHGDDTWGRLFPHALHPRSDPVTSLFVRDTVEVDANVTRHIAGEGALRDWRVLVLHYLGLDHAGHVGGRGSPRVAAKLAEMDAALRELHARTVAAERGRGEGGGGALRTLLLVASDHGMTSEGNHGGAEPEETDAVAVLIGDFPPAGPGGVARGGGGAGGCAEGWGGVREGDQVDVAPTLASLLGLPVPAGSVGRALLPALQPFPPSERLRALEANAEQLSTLLAEQGGGGEEVEHLAALHRMARREHEHWRAWARGAAASTDELVEAGADNAATVYGAFLSQAARHLQARTDRAWGRVWAGVAATAAGAGALAAAAWRSAAASAEDPWALDSWVLTAGCGGMVAALASSSLVEEEHYACHFLLATFLAATARRLLADGGRRAGGGGAMGLVAASAASARAIRWWHAGGVKWNHLPSVSTWLASAPPGAPAAAHGLAAALVLGVAALGPARPLAAGSKGEGGVGASRPESRWWLACLLGPALVAGCLYHDAADLAASGAAAPGLWPVVALARWVLACVGLALLGPLLAPALARAAGRRARPLGAEAGGAEAAARREVAWAAGACWAALQLVLQPRGSAGAVAGVYTLSAALPPALERAGVPPVPRAAAANLAGWAGFFALGGSNRLATVALGGAHVGLEGEGGGVWLPALLAVSANFMSPLLALLLAAGGDPGPPLSALVPMAQGGAAFAAVSALLPAMRAHLFLGSVFAPKYLYCAAAAGVAALGAAAQLAVAAVACVAVKTEALVVR